MATAPKIGNLPAAPNRQQPANFSAKGDALLSSLQGFATEANALGDFVEEKAGQVAIDKAAVDANVPLMNNAVAAAPLALSYSDTAKAHKDAAAASEAKAYQHAQDVASAVVYQDLASIALSKGLTMVDGCIDTSPNPSIAVQRRTSWYNETLGTSTRGTRREMPTRRVIIITETSVTIYDGDDPSLPMWMHFFVNLNTTTNYAFLVGGALDCVDMKNGRLYLGRSASVLCCDFGGDRLAYGTTLYTHDYSGYNVAQRNVAAGSLPQSAAQSVFTTLFPNAIGGVPVNHIRSVVEPDAAIDPLSGLQIPTVFLSVGVQGSPNGGTNILHHDGTLTKIEASTGAGGYASSDLAYGNGQLVTAHSYSRDYATVHIFDKLPTVNIEPTLDPANAETYKYNDVAPSLRGTRDNGLMMRGIAVDNEDIVFALSDKVSRLSRGGTKAQSMVAYTAYNYATGWMVGGIKGAWLCSTESGALVGGTLWVDQPTLTDEWSIDGGGAYTLDGTQSGFQNLLQGGFSQAPLAISFKVTNWSGGNIRSKISGVVTDTYVSGNGSYTQYLTNTSSSTGIGLEATSSFAGTISDIRVEVVAPNRSVKNEGLIVNGRIDVTPVATSAELRGFSGFSTNNYFEQPYNAELDFGTGDFCVMGWVKYSGNDGRILSRSVGLTGAPRFAVDISTSKARVFTVNSGDAVAFCAGTSTLTTGAWHHFCALRRSGNLEIYVNAKLETVAPSTHNLTNVGAKLSVGANSGGDAPLYGGHLALLRIGATAPTPEQIAKIHRDERPMFQSGAKVALHGGNNSLTCLEGDKTTGLICAGGLGGRSDLSGLVRVGQTDTPITTKIVAHDGMILEQ